jgi:hypothetical protein
MEFSRGWYAWIIWLEESHFDAFIFEEALALGEV